MRQVFSLLDGVAQEVLRVFGSAPGAVLSIATSADLLPLVAQRTAQVACTRPRVALLWVPVDWDPARGPGAASHRELAAAYRGAASTCEAEPGDGGDPVSTRDACGSEEAAIAPLPEGAPPAARHHQWLRHAGLVGARLRRAGRRPVVVLTPRAVSARGGAHEADGEAVLRAVCPSAAATGLGWIGLHVGRRAPQPAAPGWRAFDAHLGDGALLGHLRRLHRCMEEGEGSRGAGPGVQPRAESAAVHAAERAAGSAAGGPAFPHGRAGAARPAPGASPAAALKALFGALLDATEAARAQDYERALGSHRRAMALAQAAESPELRLMLELQGATYLALMGLEREALEHLARCAHRCRAARQPALEVQARVALADRLGCAGLAPQALDQYAEALRVAEQLPDPNRALACHRLLAFALARQGRREEAEQQLRAAYRLELSAPRLGARPGQELLEACRTEGHGALAVRMQRWMEAERAAATRRGAAPPGRADS